ncbi:VOC family protein [Alterisphingorhabdus coralli]|uniref:VOC family protein n=1 Tax=Alterisphingorhabdus coralli TaxID=3071408 RepID=A0AA97I038_9SPHN|nr:VOC family protein [Parasphingorhabdus sp. SCSIO 66989]WOE75394.1 VOC family protein [Parasphingorhabdus sp. SCSIO 66989]
MTKAQVRFQRANFLVADMERALTFYRDVLGFTEEFRLGHNPKSYSLAVFDMPVGAELAFVTLSTESQVRVMALTEVKGVELTAVPHPRRSAIVLEVADPDAVMAGARKLGLHVYEEEVLRTHDGRVGREIGIVDFDDNLVVIYLIEDAG